MKVYDAVLGQQFCKLAAITFVVRKIWSHRSQTKICILVDSNIFLPIALLGFKKEAVAIR